MWKINSIAKHDGTVINIHTFFLNIISVTYYDNIDNLRYQQKTKRFSWAKTKSMCELAYSNL